MIKSLGAILVPALVGGLLLVGCENQRNKTTPETDKPSVASQALAQAQSVAGSSEPAKQVEVQKVTFEITGMT